MTDPLNTKTTPPSLLLVILDIHPLSWSLLASPSADPTESSSNLVTAVHPEGPSPLSDKIPQTPLQLSEFITTLLVFLNAHLASRWGNQVVLFAAAPGRSRLLYPSPRADEMDVRPNVYHPFRLLNAGLEEGLRGMVKEEEERFKRDEGQGLNDGPEKLDTRLLVINATPGSSDTDSLDGADGMNVDQTTTKKAGNASATGAMRGGYVGLMNCVFAAQKTKVPIDVLTLPSPATGTAPPIFLQQASHLTDGIYWRWNGKGGILQYLHTIYLAPPSLRQQPFAVPPQDAVDFRAVCFCHGDVVDIGFVCSVCLSIFCKPLPVCQMCKTKFPIKSLPNLKTLAADLTPIPVPQTIPPPKPKKEKERREGKENGAKDQVREEIVID